MSHDIYTRMSAWRWGAACGALTGIVAALALPPLVPLAAATGYVCIEAARFYRSDMSVVRSIANAI